MSGFTHKVPPLSRLKIRDIAKELRIILGIDGSYFPIMEVVEFILPKLISDYELQIIDAQEMGVNHGLTFPNSNIIQLREDVYLGAVLGKPRDRLTVAHELGHLFLHKDIPVGFARVSRETIKPYESSEWQANCFAGELLVSESHVKNGDSVYDLMERFGVSHEAATKQHLEFQKCGILRK